ncbi:MAG: hypothetical protein M3P44_12115 [Actinomycetota bacterium]|nr:hypothetical protein [Actinomycetota bacterium]
MIQHVALETRRADVDAAVAFWALLGFARVEPPPSLAARAAWVQEPGGTQVHLLYAEAPVVAPEGHVAIVVADYEPALARLRAAGLAVDERTRHWGAPRSVVIAPGGHRVELMASAPVEPQA